MPRKPVFVLALMGMSPGVITELLWHLRVQKELDVTGVEIWTTSHVRRPSGADSLDQLEGFYRRLSEVVAGLPKYDVDEPVLPSEDVPKDVRVVRFVDSGGASIADVANDRIAKCVAEQLLLRVRQLTTQLGDVALIGSLSGGRKTMGAAIQTAFALHARPSDRMLHVLMHPTLEAARELHRKYAFPEVATLGVAVNAQVSVHEVMFPRLSWLSPDLSKRMSKMPYAALCDTLTVGMATNAAIEQRGTTGVLLVRRGERTLAKFTLGRRALPAYQALMAHGKLSKTKLEDELVCKAKETADPKAKGTGGDKALERLAKKMNESPLSHVIGGFIPARSARTWRLGAAIHHVD